MTKLTAYEIQTESKQVRALAYSTEEALEITSEQLQCDVASLSILSERPPSRAEKRFHKQHESKMRAEASLELVKKLTDIHSDFADILESVMEGLPEWHTKDKTRQLLAKLEVIQHTYRRNKFKKEISAFHARMTDALANPSAVEESDIRRITTELDKILNGIEKDMKQLARQVDRLKRKVGA